jgi:hypothetical protein
MPPKWEFPMKKSSTERIPWLDSNTRNDSWKCCLAQCGPALRIMVKYFSVNQRLLVLIRSVHKAESAREPLHSQEYVRVCGTSNSASFARLSYGLF